MPPHPAPPADHQASDLGALVSMRFHRFLTGQFNIGKQVMLRDFDNFFTRRKFYNILGKNPEVVRIEKTAGLPRFSRV
jgi:hypothetical protein